MLPRFYIVSVSGSLRPDIVAVICDLLKFMIFI